MNVHVQRFQLLVNLKRTHLKLKVEPITGAARNRLVVKFLAVPFSLSKRPKKTEQVTMLIKLIEQSREFNF